MRAGTYTWCFCCGCCCTGPTAPKGKTSQSDSSFLKPGEQLKRPHRHDSGVDIYANALFPPVTPGGHHDMAVCVAPQLVCICRDSIIAARCWGLVVDHWGKQHASPCR